jgi:hypothetical protein
VEQGQFKAWGYLVYDAPLTAKQIYDYELRPAPGNFDFVIEKNKQAQIVGHWEESRKMPETQRFTWFKPSINAFALREPAVAPEQREQR